MGSIKNCQQQQSISANFALLGMSFLQLRPPAVRAERTPTTPRLALDRAQHVQHTQLHQASPVQYQCPFANVLLGTQSTFLVQMLLYVPSVLPITSNQYAE